MPVRGGVNDRKTSIGCQFAVADIDSLGRVSQYDIRVRGGLAVRPDAASMIAHLR